LFKTYHSEHINKNDITLIGENALIYPPDDATDPDMNIYIEGCSNINVMNLNFNGEIDTKEYPVYSAIAFIHSSGEASNNKIEGYHRGIACYNPNPELDAMDLKITNNNISDVTDAAIGLIGNFDVEIKHNVIFCTDVSFDNWIWWFGIRMDGGTGVISKNKIELKQGSDLPEITVGIRLNKRDPAPHMAFMKELHDVDVIQNHIHRTDIGIMVNTDEFDPYWCVHGVRLLNNKFVQVDDNYLIFNECEGGEVIEIVPPDDI